MEITKYIFGPISYPKKLPPTLVCMYDRYLSTKLNIIVNCIEYTYINNKQFN